MSMFQSQLKSTLKQDIQDLNSLSDLLKQEKELLKTRESKSIEALANKKSQIIKQIETRAKAKAKLFASSGLGIRPGKIESALQAMNDPELMSLWIASREKLTLCKEQNLVNGAIITRSKQRVGRLMDIIRGKHKAPNIYGQKGKEQSFSDNHRIAKA